MRHILIAEDDNDYRKLLNDAFNMVGYKDIIITYSQDGEDLINSLKDSSPLPELILIDLNMPRKDGREVLTEIKCNNYWKHIPVIVFTTSGNTEDINFSYRHGSNSYFTKPDKFSELVCIVQLIISYWLEYAQLAHKPSLSTQSCGD